MKSKLIIPLFTITITYFLLGFVNITFAFLALVCMTVPFVLVYRDNKKTWCREYCPRAGFLTAFRGFGLKLNTPKRIIGKNMRTGFIYYFGINLFFITMSTIMVSLGRMDSIDKVRFLILFQFPWDLPQLFPTINFPAPIIHLSFRLFSLMFTSTVFGLIFAFLFRPRTWCAVCPINTLTGAVINVDKNSNIN